MGQNADARGGVDADPRKRFIRPRNHQLICVGKPLPGDERLAPVGHDRAVAEQLGHRRERSCNVNPTEDHQPGLAGKHLEEDWNGLAVGSGDVHGAAGSTPQGLEAGCANGFRIHTRDGTGDRAVIAD